MVSAADREVFFLFMKEKSVVQFLSVCKCACSLCLAFGGHSCKEIDGDINSQAISFNFTFVIQFGGQLLVGHLHFSLHCLPVTELIFEQWLTALFEIWKDRVREECFGPGRCQLGASTRVPFRWQALPSVAMGAYSLLASPVPKKAQMKNCSDISVCLFTLHLDSSLDVCAATKDNNATM